MQRHQHRNDQECDKWYQKGQNNRWCLSIAVLMLGVLVGTLVVANPLGMRASEHVPTEEMSRAPTMEEYSGIEMGGIAIDVRRPLRHTFRKCRDIECKAHGNYMLLCHRVDDRKAYLDLRQMDGHMALYDNEMSWFDLKRLLRCMRTEYGTRYADNQTEAAEAELAPKAEASESKL